MKNVSVKMIISFSIAIISGIVGEIVLNMDSQDSFMFGVLVFIASELFFLLYNQRLSEKINNAILNIFNSISKDQHFSNFFLALVIRNIRESFINGFDTNSIMITKKEEIPRRWAECHYFIDESLLITSYCSLKHWVTQNYAKSIFEDEIRLASEGIIIKRIYIYDTDEELTELKESENVKIQLDSKIDVRFISHSTIQNDNYTKNCMNNLPTIDLGIIDRNWIVFNFFDKDRKTKNMKFTCDSKMAKDSRDFFYLLWKMSD